MGKSPLTSKTLWVNLLSVLAMLLQTQFGWVFGADEQLAILALVNAGLRFVTKGPVDWSAPIKNQTGRASLPLLVLLLGLTIGGAAMLSFSGCAGTTVGDGRIDAVEEATIQVAVGLAMNAAPETIAPAYAVSTALLALMDGSEAVALSGVSDVVEKEIGKLDLLETERRSVIDLVDLIRARVRSGLVESGVTDPDQRRVIVLTVIRLVRDAAAARLGVSR